jgi:polygalacturonase/beta-glucanase (GH16 family)
MKKMTVLTALLLLPVCCFTQVIDITSPPYNASTASADNAAAIQSAITAAASGDTVLVPAGTFLSGPITLKSNMNFQLAPGAILRMLAFGTFPQNTDFIYGKNISNISITGSGVIDGQGQAWWDDFNAGNPDNRPPAMIYFSGCTGVTITGVAVQDSPKFHIQLLGACSKVYASGLSITAAWPSPNTDGMDIRGDTILIENCYISDGDDVIQLGGSSDPVSNVTIRNCTFGTGHGLSIGGYTQAGVSNLLVDNCTFNGTQYGIRWKTGRDRGGIINNLTYSNITMNGILLYPFFLTSFYPNPSSLPPTADDWVTPTATTPYWSNITLRNITASTAASGAKSPGIMWASAESPVENLLIDNVIVTGPAGVNFEIHHARGVTITCTCRVDGKQPPLNTGAFDADIYYPACGTITPSPTSTFTVQVPSKTFTPTYSRTVTATTTMTYSTTFTPTSVNTSTNTPAPSFTATPAGTCWNLVWSDEFDGTTINTANWNFETGCTGNGNAEWENYTNNASNAYVSGGNLIITAINTGGGNCGFTSARMTTQNKVHFTYGRIEARIKTPYGQGLWPAFWMMGQDISTVNWPACGEIDIMEMIGGGSGKDNVNYGTAHWDNTGHASYGLSTSVAWPEKLADNYHVYAIEWDANQIRWYFDSTQYCTLNTNGTSMEEFTGKDFFILLNVAVGGSWPGYPDGTTVFPQQMMVDYVRWYQQGTCTGPTPSPTTQVPSPTTTQDPSITASPSITPSLTGTAKPSFTQTSSFTPTFTRTNTRTFTTTSTPVMTASNTPTPQSPAATYTPTPVVTITNTPQVSVTSTPENTPSETPGSSATNTPVSTATDIITLTSTPSNTVTKTATPAATRTASATLTRTMQSTPAITQTSTVQPSATAAWQDKFEITGALAYPNPLCNVNDDLKVRIAITSPATQVKARIYTSGFRLVLESACGPVNDKQADITVSGGLLKELASGTYYLSVAGSSDKGNAVSKTSVLIILR